MVVASSSCRVFPREETAERAEIELCGDVAEEMRVHRQAGVGSNSPHYLNGKRVLGLVRLCGSGEEVGVGRSR